MKMKNLREMNVRLKEKNWMGAENKFYNVKVLKGCVGVGFNEVRPVEKPISLLHAAVEAASIAAPSENKLIKLIF